jgi:hypothetical protein
MRMRKALLDAADIAAASKPARRIARRPERSLRNLRGIKQGT